MLTYIMGYQIEASSWQVNKKNSSFELLLMDPRPVFCQFLIIQNPEQNGDSSGKTIQKQRFCFFC